MLTVLTVLKLSGEYTPERVIALRDSISKHLSIPHEFVCLSDVEIPTVRVIPLIHGWEGWYSKMELYRADLPDGPKLYLDLDTVIVGPLDELVSEALRNRFVILRDFYRGYFPRHPLYSPYAMGSGLMFWNMDLSGIYRNYVENPIKVRGGDQIILEKELRNTTVTYWQDITPAVASYKVHIRDLKHSPDKYSIICFHGSPRPWEIPSLNP